VEHAEVTQKPGYQSAGRDTFDGGKPVRREFTLTFMKHTVQQGPTTPFYKAKGSWTFYVFPNGVQEEAGHYPDQESAQRASLAAHRIWQANGRKY
jgi:hypothetical protein